MLGSYTCSTIQELDIIAEKLLKKFSDKRVFAFFGAMGAGKTTFIKSICAKLKVSDMVCSPTFQIINEYSTQDNKIIFHFDFYRIKNQQEVYDLGYEEYFDSGKYCFIEWPELIENLLPEDFVRITIVENNLSRIISF